MRLPCIYRIKASNCSFYFHLLKFSLYIWVFDITWWGRVSKAWVVRVYRAHRTVLRWSNGWLCAPNGVQNVQKNIIPILIKSSCRGFHYYKNYFWKRVISYVKRHKHLYIIYIILIPKKVMQMWKLQVDPEQRIYVNSELEGSI